MNRAQRRRGFAEMKQARGLLTWMIAAEDLRAAIAAARRPAFSRRLADRQRIRHLRVVLVIEHACRAQQDLRTCFEEDLARRGLVVIEGPRQPPRDGVKYRGSAAATGLDHRRQAGTEMPTEDWHYGRSPRTYVPPEKPQAATASHFCAPGSARTTRPESRTPPPIGDGGCSFAVRSAALTSPAKPSKAREDRHEGHQPTADGRIDR